MEPPPKISLNQVFLPLLVNLPHQHMNLPPVLNIFSSISFQCFFLLSQSLAYSFISRLGSLSSLYCFSNICIVFSLIKTIKYRRIKTIPIYATSFNNRFLINNQQFNFTFLGGQKYYLLPLCQPHLRPISTWMDQYSSLLTSHLQIEFKNYSSPPQLGHNPPPLFSFFFFFPPLSCPKYLLPWMSRLTQQWSSYCPALAPSCHW